MVDHLLISGHGKLKIPSDMHILLRDLCPACQPLSQTVSRNHGTIIRTGITCKEIPCYIRDSAFGWCVVENADMF